MTSIKEIIVKERVKKLEVYRMRQGKPHRTRVIAKSKVFSEKCEVLQCLKTFQVLLT